MLKIKNMSKRSKNKRAFLKDGWYFENELQITPKMYTQNADGICCQKSI